MPAAVVVAVQLFHARIVEIAVGVHVFPQGIEPVASTLRGREAEIGDIPAPVDDHGGVLVQGQRRDAVHGGVAVIDGPPVGVGARVGRYGDLLRPVKGAFADVRQRIGQIDLTQAAIREGPVPDLPHTLRQYDPVQGVGAVEGLLFNDLQRRRKYRHGLRQRPHDPAQHQQGQRQRDCKPAANRFHMVNPPSSVLGNPHRPDPNSPRRGLAIIIHFLLQDFNAYFFHPRHIFFILTTINTRLGTAQGS